jgi:hypothetical protein
MARRNKKYLVNYRIKGEPKPRHEVVAAQDSACALGLVLDALEDDDGADPVFEWVLIRSEKQGKTTPAARFVKSVSTVPLPDNGKRFAGLPLGVQDAYERAIAETPVVGK